MTGSAPFSTIDRSTDAANAGGLLRRESFGYSIFFLTFFCFQAVVLGFIPLHCHELNFSSFQIAVVTASENIASLTGPIALTALASGIGMRTAAIAANGLAAMAFAPLLFVRGFPAVLSLYFVSLFLSRSAMAVINAAAVRASVSGEMDYGRARLWGSVGFIAAMLGVGALVDRIGDGAIALCGLLFIVATATSCLLLHEFDAGTQRGTVREQIGALFAVLRERNTALFMASLTILWAAHGAMFTYLSLHLASLGWSGKFISVAWTVGVVAEIVVFVWFSRIEKRFPLLTIFVWSIGAMILRCLLLALSGDPWVIMLSQGLHALSFGSFYISTVKLVYFLFPPERRDQGQALLIACGGGVGALTGRLIAGATASTLAPGQPFFAIFAVSAMLAGASYLLARRVRYRS